jgi:uncharacterized repeat protein (TIGR02543 family)
VILEILRRKYATLRQSLPSSISWVLLLSLFVGLPSQVALSTTANAAACSPITSTSGDYTVVKFTTVGSCDWTAPTYASNVLLEVLMVGGGGGAGFGGNGGGGGAGQVLVTNSPLAVSSGAAINVKVAAGGNGGYNKVPNSTGPWAFGNNGESTTVVVNGNTFNAIGGGGGGGDSRNAGAAGGSGGGGALNNTSGAALVNNYSGFSSYGFAATNSSGVSAGGAGAGNTNSGRTGGAGVTIWGLDIAGGGGGWAGGAGATTFGGGSAGSGTGAGTNHGNQGVDGTGGGGGGGEKGGSGLVVIRYKTTSTICSPTTTEVDTYTIQTFTTTGLCNWTVPTGVTAAEALVVGGGGAGSAGIGNYYWPAGGGGGGVTSNSSFSTTPGQSIAINVGAGGAELGVNWVGGGTEINDGTYSNFGTLTAGGGKTPTNTLTNNLGAYGGASGNGNAGGFGGTNGSGCSSASCGAGAGGGAGGAGNVLTGGIGISSSISGTATLYGGGGAGHNGTSGTATAGGATQSVDAAANRGGGGAYGKAGGAGVVIIKYAVESLAGYSKLYFRANGGTGSIATRLVTTGSTETLPGISGIDKANSLFTSWNTQSDGTGTSYLSGAAFTVGADTSLYAQWQASSFLGTAYSATQYTWSGGQPNSNYADCPAGQVLVGAAFRQNAMSVGNYCVPLRSDLSVAPLSASERATSGYVFCPNGMVAIGYKYIGGLRLGLQCKTPPGLSDSMVETQFISGTSLIDRGSTNYVGSSMCNAGDVVVGYTRQWNLWLDGHGARCVPFAKFAITYNANGSSTTAPGNTSQTAPQQILTVAGYSGARSGFTFGGWNTLANGLGTDYAVGHQFIPASNLSLYAKWTSTITYDSNTAMSGTVPSPTLAVSSQAITVLAQNSGTLTKSGYTFSGWNTARNGSGTNYPVSNPPIITETPYMRFDAADFNDSTNAWSDTSGNSRSIPGTAVTSVSAGSIRGNPTKVTNSAGSNGSSKTFPAVQGSTADGIVLGNGALTNYTLCHVARYAGTNRNRLFAGTAGNWLSGFWSGATGVAYHEGWITASTGTNDTKWKVQCDTGGSSSLLRTNGTLKSSVSTNSTGLPANISINLQGSRSAPNTAELSDWAVAEVVIYDSVLSDAKIKELEAQLNLKYGVTDFVTVAHTFNYASTGDITLYAQWNSTITYDGNGQTSASSTVPAPTTAKGIAASTTIASQGSLLKTGSNFSGWNTRADGTGTNYASGLTTFASPGNITLYAQWTTPTGAPTLDSGSDLGTSSTDKITSDNTPTINVGTVVSGARVVITATSATGTTYTCTVESATVTSSCTFPTMADGTYSFTVQQTYNGATSVASTALSGVKIDATRPTVTLTSTVSNGANDLIARNTAITNYTITATFSEAVSGFLISEVTKDSASTAWTVGTTLSGSGASYTFTATNASVLVNTVGKLLLRIAEGVATDTAGNTNTATASDFVINSVARVDLWDCGPLGQFCTGGTGPASVTQATSGASVTLPGPNTLYKTGHTFIGWSESQTGGTVLTGSYTPTSRIILFPQWSPNVYVVTFDANGGTGAPDSATINYTYGTTGLATSSTYNRGTLAKTGYTFGGWSATASGTAVANPYSPSASLTLYAIWTAGTYAITFDSNTATSGTLTNLAITAGTAKALSANTYAKTGFSFNGWNSAANGSGTAYAAGATVTFYGNTTIYAQWKPLAPGAPTVTATTAGNTTVAVTVAAATVSGTSGSVDSFTVLTYDNAGTLVSGKSCTVLASASPLTCTISGLTNGTIYKFKTVAYNVTGNATAASFSSTATPGPYTVIYNINGGTSGAISNGSYNLGTPLTLPTPTRTSYTFAGWYDTTTAGSLIGVAGASYSPSTNITIYARWTGIAYTITYYSNGATSGTVPAPGSFTAGGVAYSVSDNTGTLARTGYTFGGWDTTTAGNGTSYAVNASYSTNANINLYAKWTPVARTVTYALNSGSGTTPTQLTNKYIGDTFTVSSASLFSRAGFAFTGWSDGTNSYAAGATYTVASSDVTLTAQWAGLSYSITYAANGGSGSLPTQINLSNGETFTVQTNSLTKTGYSFVAWNDGTANFAPGATYTMSTANVSLIAQWTATGYEITYDGNGSDGGSAPATGRYVTGGAPYSVALNTFSKTGYDFTGWKTSGAVDYAPGAGYATTANLVLIAQWAAKTISISYNVNGGSGSAPAPANWTYNANAPASLETGTGLTKTGYTFGGWAASASATAGAFTGTPSASLTYYAVWTPISYTVTYAAGTNGTGTVPTESGKTLGATFTLAVGTGLNRPAESGVTFSFAYWNDGTSNYAAGATYRMPSNNVTLTAQWIAIYNVTYNANGGVTAIASEQKTESATITIGAAATREGYTFVKWIAQSGDQFDPAASTTVTATRYIFTASWSAISRNVTYGLNGGSGSAPTTLTGKTIGQIVTLDSTTATKEGYTFGGWSIGGTTYPAGASYTIGTADVTPTAVWNAATYSISYNGNGATSGTAPGSGTFTTGGSYTASTNSGTLAKTGFTFAGWNTAANGGGTTYAEGATNVSATADLILYAKWSAATYSVTYVANGATSTLPTQSPVQFGNTFQVAAAASQNGKTFTGWSDGTNTYGGGSTYTMGAANVTLTATWANQLFAVTYSLNGGSGASAPTQISLSSTDTFTVQSTAATKSGYSFGGWSNGTNTYQANATYNMTTSNVTLTAIWNVAAPGTPGTPTVSAGDGNATITVVAPSSGGAPTSYTVTSSPGGATCTVISPATSCTVTGLTNGTSYSFSTVASNATGSSSGSASSASVSPAGKPGVPTGVTATIGNGSATVSLTPPTNTGGPAITSYTMTASPGGATCTVNAPATSCSISPLDNGTAYTFSATAFNGVARSDSSTASASVTPATVPDAPTNISATSSSSGSTTVNFSAPASNGAAITGYTVTSSPGGITCTAPANATSCSVSGLTDGVAYTFTAVATNAIGNSSASGTSASVTSAGAPSAPTSVTATVANGSSVITVSGASANGSPITSYTVQAYDGTGAAIAGKTCTITSPATTCSVSGLTNGSEYTFTATATNGVGTSAESAPSMTTTPAGAPSAPTGVSVTSGTGKVTVAWTAPAANGAPITSYTAQAYNDSGTAVAGATCTISAPSTTCDVTTNLVAGTAYTFKVNATNAAGTGSASTASSSAAINAAPSAPRNVTATASNGAATVSWDAPLDERGSAVTGYTVTAYTSGNIVAGSCTATAPTETCSVTGLTNGDLYTFKVTATNGIGTSVQSSASTAVKPSTVPNAPTAVVASAGDASASISFTAPANDGGSTITGYTVTASNGATISGTSSPLRITGLSNDVAYTFTVKATNANGDSVASSASASATPKANFAPIQSSNAQPSGLPYVGTALTSQVAFSGAPTPTLTYQWKVCDDPADLTTCTNISGATSASFTPTVSQEGKYIVVTTSASNTVGDNTVTSQPTLVINPEIIYSAPISGLSGTAGSSFVLSVVAAGGVEPFAYTVSSGTLPSGVSLDPTSGQLSGTPAAAGTYTFTVAATDSNTATKSVSVTLTIEAAPVVTPPSNSSSSSSSSSSTPAPTPTTCDATCQAAKDARAAADKAAADASAKAKADAIAKAASDKAAADAAAATAATKAQSTAQAKAAADAAAAVQAAADAAAKAASAAAAKAIADKAAADAAAAVKAANSAAASAKPGTSAAAVAANAAATKAAADAQVAVKAAAAAATAAAAAKKQVDISLSVSVSASAQAANSAAAQKEANAVAAAAKAAAEAAAAKSVAVAAAAKAAATAAANAALAAKRAAVAEQNAAVKAAADSKIAADAAAKAVAAKVAAATAAEKAATELSKALAEKAAQSSKVATSTDPTEKAAAETALAAATKKVEEVQVVAQTTAKDAEQKTTVAVEAQKDAAEAVQAAQEQSATAAVATSAVASKSAQATQAAKAATVAVAAANAATAAAKALPTTVKIAPAPKSTSNSTDGNGTKAAITGLKPGQKIKVTVKVK